MYSKETLKKYRADMLAEIAAAKDAAIAECPIVISKGNKKIGRVPNLSVASAVTCGNCAECEPYCYDVKAAVQYGNVMTARAKNTAALWYNPSGLHAALEKYFSNPRRRNKRFRFNVGGELSTRYFNIICSVLVRHADYKRGTWCYTKMYRVVNNWIAAHGGTKEALPLTVMFSEWFGVAIENPYGLPVFCCRFRDGRNEGAHNWAEMYHCPGCCDVCFENGRGCPNGESAWTWDH